MGHRFWIRNKRQSRSFCMGKTNTQPNPSSIYLFIHSTFVLLLSSSSPLILPPAPPQVHHHYPKIIVSFHFIIVIYTFYMYVIPQHKHFKLIFCKCSSPGDPFINIDTHNLFCFPSPINYRQCGMSEVVPPVGALSLSTGNRVQTKVQTNAKTDPIPRRL